MVDEGFPLVAETINEDEEFEIRPNISEADSDQFLLIVLAGNLKFIPNYFGDYKDIRMIDKITKKTAHALGVEAEELQRAIIKMQKYLTRVNHPSKNTRYAMSKALFYRYNLNQYQQEYFRNMNAPNPIFLKKLDEVLSHFIWNWESFLDHYRVTG